MNKQPLQTNLLWQELQAAVKERRRIESIGDLAFPPDFVGISNLADDLFILIKLKTYCGFLSYRLLVHPDYYRVPREQFNFIDGLIEQLNTHGRDRPLIPIYNCIRQLFEQAEQENHPLFEKTGSYIKDLTSAVSKSEKIELYSFLINYCIYHINRGEKKYEFPFLEMNARLLKLKYDGSKNHKNKIPGPLFKNVITVAIRNKSDQRFFGLLPESETKPDEIHPGLSWTRFFVDNFSRRLSVKDQKVYPDYCRSLIAFHTGNFEKAYRYIHSLNRIRTTFIKLDIKVLRLKIMMELLLKNDPIIFRKWEEIDRVRESLRILIRPGQRSAKKLGFHLQYYKDFELLYRALFRLHTRYRTSHLRKDPVFAEKYIKLSDRLKDCPHNYKEWMWEKLSLLDE